MSDQATPSDLRHRAVVVIGAGDCGARVVLRLRELGHTGQLTLVGDETREPYERPPLSKELLVDDDAVLRTTTTREQMAAQGIEWIAGTRAVRIEPDDSTVDLVDGRRVHYDALVLATGSRARQPAFPGDGTALSIRSADDALRLRDELRPGRTVAVIGGGFIGLETAASARSRGCEVVVLEFAHQLMSRVVPAPIAEQIRARHLEEGVDLRLGVGVALLECDGTRSHIVLDDGGQILSDVTVAGTGAVPNTELAATAGLEINDGIAVDDRLRTSDRSIFAAGDCCSVPHALYDGRRIRLEAWRNALDQADVVAQNVLGRDIAFDTVPSFWSDQYDLTVQVLGLHAAASREVVRRRDDGLEIRFGLDRSGRVVSASGIGPGTALARDLRRTEQLIGARAAPDQTELSNPAVDLRKLVPG